MIDPVIIPFVPVLIVAGLMVVVNRDIGHGLGVLVLGLLVGYVGVVPAGSYFETVLFGFDVVLFRVDAVTRLMGIIFGFIGAMAVVYAWASEASKVQTAIALGYVGTSLGAVFGGDWLTLVFFWELMAVTSTVLVWHYGGQAVGAGFRYAILHGIGGTLLLAAVAWQYVAMGTFVFSGDGMVGGIAVVLAGLGVGVNVGFIGLHAWLPDTYPRPHIAASVFLCVYTTKTGVYGMYRVFPEGELSIAYMGGIMAVFGAGMALLQDDMRRLLSYHIQSQVGYMVAGVGIGGALATAGAFGHVFNHILYKSLLFMTVGVIIYRTGRERLSEIGGLGRAMPVTAVTFFIAALSIAGFPGFNGFVSKGMVVTAAHYEHLDVLWYLLLIGGVGTFLSFIKLGYYAFLHGEYSGLVRDANRGQSVAMVIVAGLCVFFGVYTPGLLRLVPGSVEYHAYTLSHIGESLVLAAIAGVGFVVIKSWLAGIGRVPDIDQLYIPLVLFGTRGIVVGITELFAGVDRLVVRGSKWAKGWVKEPRGHLGQVLGTEEFQVRNDIGTGVLLILIVLVGFAWLLV